MRNFTFWHMAGIVGLAFILFAFWNVVVAYKANASPEHICLDASRSQPLWCNDYVQKAAKAARKHVVKAKKPHKHAHKHHDWRDWFKNGHKAKHRGKHHHKAKHKGHKSKSHRSRGISVHISRPDIKTPNVKGFWR